MSGAPSCLLTIIRHGRSFSSADLDDSGPLSEGHIGTLGDLRLSGLGPHHRLEERFDERHIDNGVGVVLADPHDEGINDTVGVGDRRRRDE